MLNPFLHLIEKLGSLRDGRTATADAGQNTVPAWPAPVRKPEAVIPKLTLVRRQAGRGGVAGGAMLAAPSGCPENFGLRRSDPAR